ncbi:MAG: oligosaccharide flippase family protein [Gammaproteobacteria bacterium]|nr:MAG: oligosaccharide flippase family protein [Gammaproteobacteria bacterium]
MSSVLLKKARETIGLLRLTAFDTTTDAGRSRERQRHIAWTSVTAATAKITTAVTMLITVPLTLGYLGPERFGMWMTITAVITMLGFADLGLSNGVLNAVAHASGRDAQQEIRRLISSGLFMLCMVGTAILLVFTVSYTHIPWATLFNVSSATAARETGPVVLVLVMCFLATLPLGLTQKIQMGLQRGYWANLWETLGSIGGLLGILVAIRLEAGLPWIALAMAGIPVIFRGVNTLVFFAFQKFSLRPRRININLDTARKLFSTGQLFFVLQIAVIVGFHSDNIIIARILGAEAVAGYDVALKLATLPAIFIGFVVVAQWPAYGEALTRGDMDWIRHTFTRTLRVSMTITLPFAIILLLWGDQIIRLWAGPDVVPSVSLLAGMATWSLLLVAGSVISSLLNGLHVVKLQVICAILMAIGNILVSIYLVDAVGVEGAIYGTLVAYIMLSLLPYSYYIPRYLNTLTAHNNEYSNSPHATGADR